METFAFVQWAIKFPALTLMVITRRDIGYRLLNPLILIAVFGLLAVVTIVATPGNEAANPMHLLIFCGVGFFNGLAQRIRRWRDVNRGVASHSYYIGSSPFDFRWLPYFVRRNRRVSRYLEPALWAGIGLALFPYSRALAVWLVFAAFCLKGFEDQVFRRERNRDLDLGDNISWRSHTRWRRRLLLKPKNPTYRQRTFALTMVVTTERSQFFKTSLGSPAGLLFPC